MEYRWFHEVSDLWDGQSFGFEYKEILFEEQTEYQKLAIYKSRTYGNVLTLDGIIQCTEKDEFAYHEMISFLPLNVIPNPKNVLIIGGGDGGAAREVSKFPGIEKITVCEIDKAVVDSCKSYLPSLACGFNDSKVDVLFTDGIKFMDELPDGSYDVIITDSSDPVGPAVKLFQKPYYEAMYRVLTPQGVICNQGGCLWLHQIEEIKEIQEFISDIFGDSKYATISVPSYPCGQIGFHIACKDPNIDVTLPLRTLESCKYYNSEVHKAAFVLPQFAHRINDKA